jgi:hypothetical protein
MTGDDHGDARRHPGPRRRPPVFWRLRFTQPHITQVRADHGYAGDLVAWARELLWLTLRTASRPKGTQGFVVLPGVGGSSARSAGA